MTKLALTCSKIDAWSLDSIEVTDGKRKNKHKYKGLLFESHILTLHLLDLCYPNQLIQCQPLLICFLKNVSEEKQYIYDELFNGFV